MLPGKKGKPFLYNFVLFITATFWYRFFGSLKKYKERKVTFIAIPGGFSIRVALGYVSPHSRDINVKIIEEKARERVIKVEETYVGDNLHTRMSFCFDYKWKARTPGFSHRRRGKKGQKGEAGRGKRDTSEQ